MKTLTLTLLSTFCFLLSAFAQADWHDPRWLENLNQEISSSFTLDPDVTIWTNNITANGGTVSYSTILLHDTFVKALKADNIWTNFFEICTFSGDTNATLAATLTKLKYVTSYTLTNSGSIPMSATVETGTNGGVKMNGTSYYLSTDLNPSVYSSSNFSIFAYIRGIESAGSSRAIIGAAHDGTSTRISALAWFSAGTIEIGTIGAANATAYVPLSGSPLREGLLGVTSTAGQIQTYLTNGVACLGTATSPTNNPDRVFYIGSHNSGGTANLFSTRLIKFSSIGVNIPPSAASNYNQRVQSLMTGLGSNWP